MGITHFGCALAAAVYGSLAAVTYLGVDVTTSRVVACVVLCVYVIWRDR